ncbi:MAG: LysM peptidoglycan-binding domain-containing protein [Alphaproteobacteria bacterium]|nr:LysM peptidoglycan-binding domain-containing protein [Alphaproteobacteria bacterium]
MTPSSFLLALALSIAPARADDVAELPALGPEVDGIWAWVDRLDGEVLPDEALAALDEDAAAEALLLEELRSLDIPDDYYADPRRVLTGDPYQLGLLDPSEFDLPLVLNAHVERWLGVLTGPGRKYFRVWLQRKARYEPMINAELDAAGLPRDLIYLSMIESGFNSYALSSASAGGLWQFIPTTARLYDLQVDFWLDERRDPEKATRAALAMLSSLHNRFGDWYLAFAAYNTGPARIARALDRAESDGGKVDYWALLEQDLLHRETEGYVPKIIAAMIIAKHPERYGFTDIVPEAPLSYDSVRINDAVDVDVLATCAGLDEDGFRALNPALRRYAVPEGGVDLRVPLGAADTFLAALDAVPAAERRRIVMHEVSRGESLSGIASRYGVSLSEVQSANHIRNANQIAIGQKLVIPMMGASVDAVLQTRRVDAPAASAPAKAAPSTPTAEPVKRPTTYTVRSGDALSEIAERTGVSMADLQRFNGVTDPSRIQVGQTLRLTAPEGQAAAPAAAAAKTTTYTVRSGDTLSEIAARFGVSVADLVRWNGLKDASAVRAGQSLKLVEPAVSWRSHTVAKGESLGIIANRYGVSVSDLIAWNHLKGSTIYPGDTLRIRAK